MPFPNPLGEIAGVVPSTSLDYEHSIGHLNKTETDGFEMIATRPLGGYTGSLRGVLYVYYDSGSTESFKILKSNKKVMYVQRLSSYTTYIKFVRM